MTTVKGVSAEAASKISALKPAHFRLEDVIRPNILSLKPYRCARDDYQSGILLDANENSIGHSLPEGASIPHTAQASVNSSAVASGSRTGVNGNTATPSKRKAGINGASDDATETLLVNGQTPITGSGADDPLSLNRYPDPSLYGIKPTLAKLRNVDSADNVFLGVGSDEILDLVQRVAAAPGKDEILICPPTYGMYSVCAAVNDIKVNEVPLVLEGGRFSLDVDKVCETLAANPRIKLVFLCSPGNPTGTLLSLDDVRRVLDFPQYKGIVVVDEAYIDFAEEEIRMGKRDATVPVSAVQLTKEYANIIVTQTLSKSFGLAAIRLGIAYAQAGLIQIMNNTKAPYNISVPTAHLASLALSPAGLDRMRTNVQTLLANRDTLIRALQTIPGIGPILGANDANFVMATILDAPAEQGGKPDSERAAIIYKRMAEERGCVVRNRASELGCAGCLRISIGTAEENVRCVELIRQLLSTGDWAEDAPAPESASMPATTVNGAPAKDRD